MTTPKKRTASLLLSALLMTGCASYKPPSVPEVQIPRPSAELMIRETESSINVPALLQEWTRMLSAWRVKLELCKTMPTSCT